MGWWTPSKFSKLVSPDPFRIRIRRVDGPSKFSKLVSPDPFRIRIRVGWGWRLASGSWGGLLTDCLHRVVILGFLLIFRFSFKNFLFNFYILALAPFLRTLKEEGPYPFIVRIPYFVGGGIGTPEEKLLDKRSELKYPSSFRKKNQ